MFARSYNFEGLLPPFFHPGKAFWHHCGNLGAPWGTILFACSYNFEGLLLPFFHLGRAFWHHCGSLGAPWETMRGLGFTFPTACAKTMTCGRFPPPPVPKFESSNVSFSFFRRTTMRCDVIDGVLNTRRAACRFLG